MATLQRRKQPVSPSLGAIGYRSSDVEATEPEPVDVRGVAPLLAGDIIASAMPAGDRRRPMDAASVLALQRTHGNAVVGRLIARSTPASPGAEADANAAALGSAGGGPAPHGDDATRSPAVQRTPSMSGEDPAAIEPEIFLRQGEDNPSSRAGQELLVHGMTHAVQRQPDDPPVIPESYRIEGGKYSPKEKKHAAQHPAGLVRTSSVVGKLEQKLATGGPTPIFVSKELMRFEAGRLGEFVSDYNDFTHYLGEVLHGIGRLRDLLSAGAPEDPTNMTATQERALRPTDDTQPSGAKKRAYREWRTMQATYATTHTKGKGALPDGLVFEVAQTGRDFELARQEYWQAKGRLSRTIAAAKRLDRPKMEALEGILNIATALATDGLLAVATVAAEVINAREKRKEYDAKMKEFGDVVKDTNDAVRDEFEAFQGAGTTYWTKLEDHQTAIQKRDKARIESRQLAALAGQETAHPSETRGRVLAEVRMPQLVADAWHALATIGPPTRAKLSEVLAGRGVVERASFHYEKWRSDPLGLEDITQIRRAWQRALSWEVVLTKDDVEEWVAMNKMWEETFVTFNV